MSWDSQTSTIFSVVFCVSVNLTPKTATRSLKYIRVSNGHSDYFTQYQKFLISYFLYKQKTLNRSILSAEFRNKINVKPTTIQ